MVLRDAFLFHGFPQGTEIYHIEHPFPLKDNSIIGVVVEKQYCGDTPQMCRIDMWTGGSYYVQTIKNK